eukprot:GFUD01031979.1.p1 GENE.GFUD01031979.1~~GFUD01031979.1.p1  ORF type:complete len:329 (-),score=114.24 GFUD01031979.1:22-1008(-)
MCGRTANTLSPTAIVQACSYKKPADGAAAVVKQSAGGAACHAAADDVCNAATEDGAAAFNCEEGSDTSSTLVPVWTEAPCGGKFFPSTNIPPTSYTPILYKSADQLVLQPMLWGLVPRWHAGPDPKSHGLTTNNCRLENVMTSKLYKPCLAKGRCVVVCQGFYEWERSGSVKQPYLVYRAGGGEEEDLGLLYMAGLYSVWRGGDGVPVYNYTIITRESNKVLSWLHHRMPSFLSPSQFSDWLNPSMAPTKALAMLSLPGEGELAWHPVSRDVGNVRNQQMDLMKKVEPEEDESKKKSVVKVSAASKGIMSNWLKRSQPEQEGGEKRMK